MQVPATVTVPAGVTDATFTITTRAVSSSETILVCANDARGVCGSGLNGGLKEDITLSAPPAVSAVTPSLLRLKAGGDEGDIAVKGSNLFYVTSVVVVQNGAPSQTVSGRILATSATASSLTILLKAASQAVPGTAYQLRLVLGSTFVDVPSSALSLEVIPR